MKQRVKTSDDLTGDIEETEEMRLERLNNEAQRQEIKRLKRNLEETEQMKNARLKSEREWKRTRRSVRHKSRYGSIHVIC